MTPQDVTELRKVHVARLAANVALVQTLAPLHKKYGVEHLRPLIGRPRMEIRAIPSGWQELDDLLTGESDARNRTISGTGLGWPRGRIIELFGPEGAGKTTLALHAIKAVQRAGGRAVFIDAEHSLDAKYAARIGVDLSSMLFDQPDSAEQVIDMTADLARTKAADLVVIDSIAVLEPEAEEKTSIRKSHVALGARLMSQGLRKLNPQVARADMLLICINQIRTKIGVMFGNPETTPGGKALKFYASLRIDVRKVKTLKKGTDKIGSRAKIYVAKNKCAAPFRQIHVDIKPNAGIVAAYAEPDFEETDE